MASLEEQVQQVQGFRRRRNEYVGNEQSSAIWSQWKTFIDLIGARMLPVAFA